MLEIAILAAVAALVGWLMNRKRRQRSAAVAAGETAGVPCMLKWSAHGSRWRAGRLLIGAGPPVWKASWGGRELALPTDLRRTGTRAPSTREGMSINPGSRILEYASSAGVVLIAVMPDELDLVGKALESA
ncbi:hypothetical protein AB0B30_18395 [Streptomyces narbonensis]|uniref:DUF2550 family protein n=1 Tax=Streptomyces narbonensis TaxID=67333 RepID=A0ABV3C670_9ACTN